MHNQIRINKPVAFDKFNTFLLFPKNRKSSTNIYIYIYILLTAPPPLPTHCSPHPPPPHPPAIITCFLAISVFYLSAPRHYKSRFCALSKIYFWNFAQGKVEKYHKNHLLIAKNDEKKTVKAVEINIFLVCAWKSQNFAQSQNNFFAVAQHWDHHF